MLPLPQNLPTSTFLISMTQLIVFNVQKKACKFFLYSSLACIDGRIFAARVSSYRLFKVSLFPLLRSCIRRDLGRCKLVRVEDRSVDVQLYLLNFRICIKRKVLFVLTTPVGSLLRHCKFFQGAWCPDAKDSTGSIESLHGAER